MAHPIVAYVIELVFVVVVAHRFTDNRLHGRSNNIVVVSDYLTDTCSLVAYSKRQLNAICRRGFRIDVKRVYHQNRKKKNVKTRFNLKIKSKIQPKHGLNLHIICEVALQLQ